MENTENIEKIESKTMKVSMTFPALLDFVLRSYYTKMSGFASLVVGLLGIVLAIMTIAAKNGNIKAILCYFLVAVICLVMNPLQLVIKTKSQLKTNPSYKEPIFYEFGLGGITLKLGEQEQFVPWLEVTRVLGTSKMLAIYTSPIHAFVIPNTAFTDEKEKAIIVRRIVQYTQPANPRLSKNLKELRNGTDHSKNL